MSCPTFNVFELLRQIDDAEKMWSYPMTGKTIKVDPSVRREETEMKGEPLGSVPLERTMKKPDAYYPPKSGPK